MNAIGPQLLRDLIDYLGTDPTMENGGIDKGTTAKSETIPVRKHQTQSECGE